MSHGAAGRLELTESIVPTDLSWVDELMRYVKAQTHIPSIEPLRSSLAAAPSINVTGNTVTADQGSIAAAVMIIYGQSRPKEISSFGVAKKISHYVPRRELEEQIASKLAHTGTSVIAALKGMGGIGKTVLASHVLHTRPEKIKIWFDAESRQRLYEQYETFLLDCDVLSIEKRQEIALHPHKTEIVIATVKRYLAERENWLVVYDNANTYDEIRDFLPALKDSGKIIITSQSRDWPRAGLIEVDVMTEAEAMQLVIEIAGESNFDDIKALVRELGYFPLALSQAAAYMADQRVSAKAYLRLYQGRKAELLITDCKPADHLHVNVWITFVLALEKVYEKNPLAVALLYYAGYLAASDIPLTLLGCIHYKSNEWISTQLPTIKQALAILEAYSLLRGRGVDDKVVYSIHRVLQKFLHVSIPLEIESKLVEPVMYGMLDDYQLSEKDERVNMEHIRLLLPHFEQVDQTLSCEATLAHLKARPLAHANYAVFLNNYAGCVDHLGYSNKKKELIERALNFLNIYYPTASSILLQLQISLANVHGELGDYIKKKEILDQVLAIQKAYYGEKHIEVAKTLHSYANVYSNLGKHEMAKELLEKCLAIHTDYYGEHDINTAIAKNSLAIVYGDLGDHEKELQLLEQALEIERAYYGENHVLIVKALINIGKAHLRREKFNEAEKVLEQALAIATAHYGEGHIELTKIQNNLAVTYLKIGKNDEAITLLEQILPVIKSYYGENHIEVAKILINISGALDFKEHARSLQLLKKAESILKTQPGGEQYLAGCRDGMEYIQKTAYLLSLGYDDQLYNLKGYQLVDTGRVAEANEVFKKALKQSISFASMASYANFLIHQFDSAYIAVDYIWQVRESEQDAYVLFFSKNQVSSDAILKAWFEHNENKLEISSWVLATWLLFNIYINRNEIQQARALLPAWISRHALIKSDENLSQCSWYLLGHAAVKLNDPKLAWQCFTCVENLPKETQEIMAKLDIDQDLELLVESNFTIRQQLLQIKLFLAGRIEPLETNLDFSEAKFKEYLWVHSLVHRATNHESTPKEWPNYMITEGNVISESEAINLVLKIAGMDQAEDVKALVKELAYFPLAISLAAAYMSNQAMPAKVYLNLYKDIQAEFLTINDIAVDHMGIKAWITFILSLKKIYEESPLATKLLFYSSYLATTKIPLTLLGAIHFCNSEWIIQAHQSNAIKQALALLKKYYLLSIDSSPMHTIYFINNTIQKLLQICLDEGIKLNLLIASIMGVNTDYKYLKESSYNTAQQLEWLLPHFKQLHGILNKKEVQDMLKTRPIDYVNYAMFIHNYGVYKMELADFLGSKDLFEEALTIKKSYHGENHFEVSKTINNLAGIYCRLGYLSHAIKLWEQALAIRKAHYGEHHVEVAKVQLNLASALSHLNRFDDALILLEKAESVFKTQAGGERYLKDCQTIKTAMGIKLPRKFLKLNDNSYLEIVRRLISQSKLLEADAAFKATLELSRSLDNMAHYVNFLINQFDSSYLAINYIWEIRESETDFNVLFVSQDRESLDGRLKAWLDHCNGKANVSSWILATWLLFNIYVDRSEFPQAKGLLSNWILNHTRIRGSKELSNNSWYLLGYAALKLDDKALAANCFACVEHLPDETRAIQLSLEQDPDIDKEADIATRRVLVHAKFMSRQVTEISENVSNMGSPGAAGGAGVVTDVAVFASQARAIQADAHAEASP